MASQIVVEMTGQEAKLWQSLQKVVGQQQKMEDGFKKTGQTARDTGNKMKTAGDQGSKAFGDGAVGKLAQFAAGFVGISAVVSTVTQLLNDMAQTAEEAATKAKESVIGAGTLAQLAASPEEFKALLAEGRTAYASGVGRSETEAMDLMYQLQSAGFSKQDKDLMNRMAGVGYLKTGDVTEMVGAIKGFGASMGIKETGSVRDLVNKAIGAAGTTSASPAAMLIGGAKATGAAAALGLSDEELWAAMGITTAKVVDPRIAGTQINAFLSKVAADEEFEGKGMSLKQIIETIQAKNLKRADLELLTGGIRGIKGYEAVATSMGDYEALLADVQAAQAKDPLTEQLKFYQADPKIKYALGATAAAHEAEMSRDKLGQMKNLADTVLDKYEVQRRKEDDGLIFSTEWEIALTRLQSGLARKMYGNEAWLRTRAAAGDWIEDPELREDVRGLVGRPHGEPAFYIKPLGPQLGLAMPTPVAAPAAPAPENIHDWQPDMAAAAGDLREASQSMRDGSRGPTLVPPNVDR